jgi:asparagine synthase (glutamine-hydrolysing)
MLRHGFRDVIPADILGRRDKMGFPVPLNQWLSGELRDLAQDIFSSRGARERDYMNGQAVRAAMSGSKGFSRKAWGLLSLELWSQQFLDQTQRFEPGRAPATARV